MENPALRRPVLSSITLGFALIGPTFAQQLPLVPAGAEPATGGLVWSLDHVGVEALDELGLATFAQVPLPDGSFVRLALERIRPERYGFAFHVDGAPAGDLLDGLALSLWKGEIAGLPGSDVRLAFSHLGAQGHGVGTGDKGVFVFVFTGAADHQACGAAVVDAEFGLQAVGGGFFAGQFQHQ